MPLAQRNTRLFYTLVAPPSCAASRRPRRGWGPAPVSRPAAPASLGPPLPPHGRAPEARPAPAARRGRGHLATLGPRNALRTPSSPPGCRVHRRAPPKTSTPAAPGPAPPPAAESSPRSSDPSPRTPCAAPNRTSAWSRSPGWPTGADHPFFSGLSPGAGEWLVPEANPPQTLHVGGADRQAMGPLVASGPPQGRATVQAQSSPLENDAATVVPSGASASSSMVRSGPTSSASCRPSRPSKIRMCPALVGMATT